MTVELERGDAAEPLGAPLAGLRIVDFSRMLAGPLSTMVMGDLGAHVIRVEDLEGTDAARHHHPLINGESHCFLAFNRNKESVALDLESAEGRAIAIDLVRQADIVVENFGVDAAARLGLDYASLTEVNPRLVYCSVSGFGQTGPWASKTADDLVIQATTGVLSITGEPGRPPAKMGPPLIEQMSSLFAGVAMLAGVERRDRTGRGCHLDIAMFDAGVSMLTYMASAFFATGESLGAQGSAHPTIYPYNAFETADGHIVVAPFTEAFWRKFGAAIGRPDLPDNAAYESFADRLQRRVELAAILDPIMRTRTTAQWERLLDQGDVPNGPVLQVDQVVDHPQTRARGMVVEIDHPVCGRFPTLGSPFRFLDADGREFRPRYAPPPVVGQHTVAVLRALLGKSEAQIDALAKAKAIRVSNVPGETRGTRRAAQTAAPSADAANEPPLAGLRVIDLTRILAGPYGTLILADLGADVIKVEEPPIGDPTRRNIPLMVGESTYFMAINRGKRSVTLDLKTPAGREALLELVKTADVVIENYRPGVMERLGLDFASLTRVKPGIILCSISGYGRTGPLREKISFDLVNQAMAGTMAVTGEEGRPPVRVGLPAGDLSGGIFGALAILAALYGRRRGGRGSHIDLGLHDLLVSLLGDVAQLRFTTGEVPGPAGNGHRHIAPYRAFRAADGWLVVAAFTQIFWLEFAKVIGRSELADDPRFADIAARKHNQDALDAIIDPIVATRSVDEWLEALRVGDVPAARVHSVGEALESEQSRARGIVFDVEHPTVGTNRVGGTPFLADGKPWRSTRPAPLLGEHNDEILGRLSEDDQGRITRATSG